MEKYSIQYFIDKFEKIPEELWCMEVYNHPENSDCRCAYGHCGVNSENDVNGYTEEAKALNKLSGNTHITGINDNPGGAYSHLGSTPKQRILNFLKGLKDETN